MPPAISRRIVAESLDVLLVFLMVFQIFSVYDLFIVAVTPISELVATLTSHHEMVEDLRHVCCLRSRLSILRCPILSAGFHTSCGQVSHVCWLHSTFLALNFPHLCDSNDTREQMALAEFPPWLLKPFLLLQLPRVGKNTFSP